MERTLTSRASSSAQVRTRALPRVDWPAVSIWALSFALVVYLSLQGGGYDLVVRNQIGVAVWWMVVLGAAVGALPLRRLHPAAWAAVGLLAAFAAWTGLASTWSQSSERSLDELSRLAMYLGVLVLALAVHRHRRRSALRHTVNALAAGIAVVAGVALLTRLHPGLIAGAQQTAAGLPGSRARLSYPLNYWNALAAFVAIGLPLVLVVACSARTILAKAAGAAALPMMALCAYLTLSRGGAVEAAIGLIVFLGLAPDRVPKLGTMLVAGGGSAALIAGAIHRPAIEQGLSNAAARDQGATLLTIVIVVCVGVGLVQAGIGLAARYATRPRWLVIPRRSATVLLAAALVAVIGVGLAAHGPARLSDAWQAFKTPRISTLNATQMQSIARFGAASGNGRYDLWKSALHAGERHPIKGIGPGTYEFWWTPRAPYYSFVRNAHSLYLETFAETGLVGLALLATFLALVLASGVLATLRCAGERQAAAAAATAACAAFCVAAAIDWVWQVAVLPATFMLVAAALLTRRPRGAALVRRPRWATTRALPALAGVAAIVAIAIPLALTTAVRDSQAMAQASQLRPALADARKAVSLEPGAATPQMQQALVLEQGRDLSAAAIAAGKAVDAERTNWRNWLVLSRIQAERGHANAAVRAYRRARALNPTSPIFKR